MEYLCKSNHTLPTYFPPNVTDSLRGRGRQKTAPESLAIFIIINGDIVNP